MLVLMVRILGAVSDESKETDIVGGVAGVVGRRGRERVPEFGVLIVHGSGLTCDTSHLEIELWRGTPFRTRWPCVTRRL